jgi:mRNA interferase MazF
MIKGKIVLVPFPFDDLTALKVRPAVCLTNSIGLHRHVILAFISSRIPQDLLQSDVVLDRGHPEFNVTGLHVTSTVRLHRLMTATTSLFQRELGVLSFSVQTEVARKLNRLFELRSK